MGPGVLLLHNGGFPWSTFSSLCFMNGGFLLLVVCRALGGIPGMNSIRGALKGLQTVIGPSLVASKERTLLASSDFSLAQSRSNGMLKEMVGGEMRGMEKRIRPETMNAQLSAVGHGGA